jgi:PadR family transcriptional regulator, regulatory protein PadR
MTVARVLRAFLEDTARPRYGFELMRLTGLPSGTLYPILARLESAGWLTSMREDIDAAAARRPTRRMYLIDADAAQAARAELAELSNQLRPPSTIPSSLQPRGSISW